jgi:cellulose synthase (UDP-forming)
VQIDYSEDAHTGFALVSAGYRLRYMPVLLAIGLCPGNSYSFFHQQHRWCMGSMRLMKSKKFWHAPVSWKIKFCFITGFLFYLHHPFVLLLSFQLFWTLFLYNDYIPLSQSAIFYPHFIFAFIYLFMFPIAKIRAGYFHILIARTYAYTHALKTSLMNKSVSWVSTNAKHAVVSRAFKHTLYAVGSYVALYGFLFFSAAFLGLLHPFNIKYYSVQFWLFYNMTLSLFLFVQMYRFYRSKKQSIVG